LGIHFARTSQNGRRSQKKESTIWKKIKKLSDFRKLPWESFVKEATWATNISFNKLIGTSPYILLNKQRPKLKQDIGTTNLIQLDYNIILKRKRLLFESYKKSIIKGKK
jgi:hypothetical protein